MTDRVQRAAIRHGLILMVEDDEDDARLIARAFRRIDPGIPIQRVEDGEQAVAYLAGSAPFGPDRVFPVLVLLDLKLPRKSGFEVLQWLKNQPSIRRIPVVILTSSKERIDLARAYDLGANSYLVKPVRPHAVSNLMANIDSYWLSSNEPPPLGAR